MLRVRLALLVFLLMPAAANLLTGCASEDPEIDWPDEESDDDTWDDFADDDDDDNDDNDDNNDSDDTTDYDCADYYGHLYNDCQIAFVDAYGNTIPLDDLIGACEAGDADLGLDGDIVACIEAYWDDCGAILECLNGLFDDDDDDDDNDDNDNGYSCEEVADGMINTCAITLIDLNGAQQDETGLADWCSLSESLFVAKTAAPFWNCMGGCVYELYCSQPCFDGCLDPGDPGAGCGSAVNGIYACGVVFTFNDNEDYWIPEMDIQAACVNMGEPWDCYQDCVDSVTCSVPPNQQEAQAMIDCLNACQNSC